jgi:hypothetical protein
MKMVATTGKKSRKKSGDCGLDHFRYIFNFLEGDEKIP